MELLLVLDRSGSIGQSMPTLLSFARDLVGEFDIGPSLTRVGLVQVGARAAEACLVSRSCTHMCIRVPCV